MYFIYLIRGGSRAAATSKLEGFVIIVNGWKPIITKRSILDVAAALDLLLLMAPIDFINNHKHSAWSYFRLHVHIIEQNTHQG